jgi:hypothetical protein
MTVAAAAEALGVSKEVVRKRITRGTLRSEKDPDGTVHVYVPPSGTPSGTPPVRRSWEIGTSSTRSSASGSPTWSARWRRSVRLDAAPTRCWHVPWTSYRP